MEVPEATGRYIYSAGTASARHVVTLLRAQGFDGYRLPRLGLDTPLGTRLVKLASWTQPKGIGQYLRTNVGPPLRFDNTKICRDLGLSFRPIDPTIVETAADVVRWGHAAAR